MDRLIRFVLVMNGIKSVHLTIGVRMAILLAYGRPQNGIVGRLFDFNTAVSSL